MKLNKLGPILDRGVGGPSGANDALLSIFTEAKTAGISDLSAFMLEFVLQLSALEYDLSQHFRRMLKRRFIKETTDSDTPAFLRVFPLFFAQEMKDGPKLHAILVHQKLFSISQEIRSLKEGTDEYHAQAQKQADALLLAMRESDKKTNALWHKQLRANEEIQSALGRIESKSAAEFEDMFRDPDKGQGDFESTSDDVKHFHFSSEQNKFVGREKYLSRINKEFLSYSDTERTIDDAFRWMLISGEAGTGKSRLAQEIIRKHKGRFKCSGFAAEHLLKNDRFGRDHQHGIKDPVLIVVDYAVGHQDKMPAFMRGWAEYARKAVGMNGPPVRIILLLRRADDRVLDDIRSENQIHADSLVASSEVFRGEDGIELEQLSDNETAELMKARINLTAKYHNEDPIDFGKKSALLNKLDEYDNKRRPLFALMVAHAMQRKALPDPKSENDQEAARIELFTSYLRGQWGKNWRKSIKAPDNESADEIVAPHANLMRIVTACGGPSREEILECLRSLPNKDEALSELLPSSSKRSKYKLLDKLIVSMAGGRGQMNDGQVDPLPTLEPDLIGECFFIMTCKDFDVGAEFWCNAQNIIDLAREINPGKTAQFIRQVSQNYPKRARDANWFPNTSEGK